LEKENDHSLIQPPMSSTLIYEQVSPQQPLPVIKIPRQNAIDKIISNLLVCGIILPGEEVGYRSVIQSYDDEKLLNTLEYSEQLRIPPHEN
jgi:hypothetical protein